MITEVKEKKVMSIRDVDYEYDGKWVIFDWRPYSTSGGQGCVVAYGDGTEDDYETLRQVIINKYNRKALLKFGYAPKEDVVYGMYDVGVAT